MNKKILLSFLLVSFIQIASAVVPASVDRSTVEQGQSFTLNIDISKASGEPNLSALQQNFEILSTGSSSQTNIVNGSISSQKTYSIMLMPKTSGQIQIPAIRVGNDVTTPITIDVTAGATSPSTSTATPNTGSAASKVDKIHINASIAKQSTYAGIPVPFTVKVYFSIPIANVSMQNINIDNAKIEPSGKATQYQANENGNTYQVIEQKFLITPSKPGDIHIPPVTVNGTAMDDQTNSFLPMQQQKPFVRTSKAVTLHVKSTPAGINPSDWLPAKKLEVNENWSNTGTELKVGQPLTRTISIQALGIPASSIPELTFTNPKGVNAYPDKTTSSDTPNNDDNLATKTFKIAYVPTQVGKIEFPEVTVKWWDTTSDSLKTSTMPAKLYTVISDGSTSLTDSSAPIKGSQTVNATLTPTQNNLWFYIALASGVLWLVTIVIGMILFRKKPKSPTVTQEKPKAVSKVQKLDNKKKALANVVKACRTQNLTTLNQSLIDWAALHWKRNIYTVSDIKGLATSQELSRLIEQLNLALYRGADFTEFAALQHEVEVVGQVKVAHADDDLKEFYPK